MSHTTVFVSGNRDVSSGSNMEQRYDRTEYSTGNAGMPRWYQKLFTWMVMLTVILLICFMVVRSQSTGGTIREELPAEACVTVDTWIDDRVDWISNDSLVIKSMDYFQDKTGIQPYLLITDTIEGKGGDITDQEAEEYLAGLYDSLYDDEGHMIFTFMEYANSQYITYIYTGTAADSVMDSEARNIFLDNADYYYTDSSLSDDEYFAKIFERSADEIMRDRTSVSTVLGVLAVGCGLIAITLAGGYMLFKIQEKKAEEAETLRDVVNTPLGQSPEEKELEEKYGNNNTDN